MGLRCLTMVWAICVVEDVSIYLWTMLTLEFKATLERPPFLPGCKLILRRRLVQRIQLISQLHPSLFAAAICEADDPCVCTTVIFYCVSSEHDSTFAFSLVPTRHS